MAPDGTPTLNRCQLVGRVAGAPRPGATGRGTPLTTFVVAVPRARRGTDGVPRDGTDFIRIVSFAGLAARAARLAPGDLVLVEGQLQLDSYRDRDGVERATVEVVANLLLALAGE